MAQQAIAKALTGVHNLTIDEAALRAHVMKPAHLEGVISSEGLEGGLARHEYKLPKGPSYKFDGNGFCAALHAALKSEVAGYMMRLRQHGATIATLEWNWAKERSDGGQPWKPNVRMHLASCSKLITAIAMTKLLNDKKLPKGYDTPIISHLPKYWSMGKNVDKITFRHLMTHTSGLNFANKSSASDYEFMKSQVAAGTNNLGQYWYQNMNFGLCRILIATINGNISPDTNFPANLFVPFAGLVNDVTWDSLCIQAYVQYVKDHLFKPSGVSGPTLNHPDGDALAYTFPVSGSGWNSGDITAAVGGVGWHMSVDELLDVMSTFRRKGTIMSPAQAQTMLDSGFGIDVIASTPLGNLYNKNGRWADTSPPNDHDEQTLGYFLPEDMELVVFTNSPVGSPAQFFRSVVTNIYVAHIKS